VSSTHEHLEHAEHAEHAAHSSFDRRVAVTVAIIAAILAGVAMLGHRKHNDTLIHKTHKGQLEVKESNTWAQYQAKRLRQAMAQLQIQTLTRLPHDKWPGPDADHDPDIAKLKAEIARYDVELKELKEKAEGVQKEVAKADADAEHAHHQADWLDYAHLAVELGLVVCSLGILTKRKMFWLAGMAVTVVGIALTTYALTMPGHHADSPGHAEESKDAKPPSGGH
jgi:Domain of unknown function (DUF4337)